MEHVFIINPVSGKENPKAAIMQLIDQYKAAHNDFDAVFKLTEYAGHACEIAENYGKSGQNIRLYSIGGDGTLNEIFQGAYKYKNIEVAALPFGTGNDFIRNFGFNKDFLQLDTQINGKSIAIDLVETDKNICASITSVGLDAEVAYGIPKFRRLPFFNGSMAYNASIVQRLFRPMGQNMLVKIDDKTIKGNYLIVTVCNGGFYGGGYNAAPISKIDDGILNVILVKKMSRLLIANVIGLYKNGKHFDGDVIADKLTNLIEHHTGTEITVEPESSDGFILNIDGECGEAPRMFAKVLPLAGRFVLPLPIYENYVSGGK